MAVYDITNTNTVFEAGQLKNNDEIHCGYSGAMRQLTLPPGKYQIEC